MGALASRSLGDGCMRDGTRSLAGRRWLVEAGYARPADTRCFEQALGSPRGASPALPSASEIEPRSSVGEIRKNLTTSIYSSIQWYCERRDSSWSATPNVDRHERRGESMHALNILLLTERSSLRERDREKAESLPITKSPVLARDCLSLEADHGSGGGA